VGAAAATSTAVGAWGSGDVEPDHQWLGILEQQNMDSDLTVQPVPAASAGPIHRCKYARSSVLDRAGSGGAMTID
jgi:hypothetical protein